MPDSASDAESQELASDSQLPPDALIKKDDGMNYWRGVKPDINGMLGGLPFVSKVDLQGSRNFLAKLGVGIKPGQRTVANVLEGGAGIGRITTGLLTAIAEEVDVIEPMDTFTASLQGKEGVRSVFNVGLEEWHPAAGTHYDLIWVQWCVGHLTDRQLVQFLERCKTVLSSDGFIIIKENLSTSGVDVFDELDSSVTREDDKFLKIFSQAGFRVIKMEIQKGFPKKVTEMLLPIKMYALKPDESEGASARTEEA